MILSPASRLRQRPASGWSSTSRCPGQPGTETANKIISDFGNGGNDRALRRHGDAARRADRHRPRGRGRRGVRRGRSRRGPDCACRRGQHRRQGLPHQGRPHGVRAGLLPVPARPDGEAADRRRSAARHDCGAARAARPSGSPARTRSPSATPAAAAPACSPRRCSAALGALARAGVRLRVVPGVPAAGRRRGVDPDDVHLLLPLTYADRRVVHRRVPGRADRARRRDRLLAAPRHPLARGTRPRPRQPRRGRRRDGDRRARGRASAACTVAIGLLALVVLPVPFMRSIGIGGALIPLASVLDDADADCRRSSAASARGSTGRRSGTRTTASRAWAGWATRRRAPPRASRPSSRSSILGALFARVRSASRSAWQARARSPRTARRTTPSRQLKRGGVPTGVLTPMRGAGHDRQGADAVAAAARRSVDGVAARGGRRPDPGNDRDGHTRRDASIPTSETVNSATVGTGPRTSRTRPTGCPA